MRNLPLFYYPSTWIFVDDDSLILESVSSTIGKYNKIEAFKSSLSCFDFLQIYQSPLSKQSFLQNSNVHTQYDDSNFDFKFISILADLPNRHNEITVIVIDYNMPNLNGVSLAQKMHHLPIYKILLTGAVQPDQAVILYNQKIIHCFIKKGELDGSEKLINRLNQFTLQYFQEKTSVLLSYLERKSDLPLSDATFISFFNNYCKQYKIKEYYLIDKYGSFLCIDSKGERSYLIIHTDNSLKEWLTSDQYCSLLSESNLAEIVQRTKIPFLMIDKKYLNIESLEPQISFLTPQILEGRSRYFWAQVKIK